MGIVNFYKQFKAIFPQSIYMDHRNYDVVCFDMNQWIHSFYDFEQSAAAQSTCVATSLAHRALIMMQYYVRKHNTKTVVVVMDGMCPFPKLVLQKNRRKKISLQRLQISVGTQFMALFSDVLLSLLKSNLSFVHLFYSDSSQKGEGEHKIARIIKKFELENVLVVCIDADFIMLCIAQQLKHVHILRKCKHYCEIVDMNCVYESLTCSCENFFVNVCFLGNDYLPRICNSFSFEEYCEKGSDFPSKLCVGDVYDENCQKYLEHLYWTVLYYKDMNICTVPSNQCPKVTLKVVKMHKQEMVKFEPVKDVYNSTEFHMLYTIPNWKYLPSTLQIYFKPFDNFVDLEDIDYFLDFWSEMLTFPKCSVIKFSRTQ